MCNNGRVSRPRAPLQRRTMSRPDSRSHRHRRSGTCRPRESRLQRRRRKLKCKQSICLLSHPFLLLTRSVRNKSQSPSGHRRRCRSTKGRVSLMARIKVRRIGQDRSPTQSRENRAFLPVRVLCGQKRMKTARTTLDSIRNIDNSRRTHPTLLARIPLRVEKSFRGSVKLVTLRQNRHLIMAVQPIYRTRVSKK